MKTKWVFWVSVVALAVLPACGGDDDDDDNGGGAAGTGATSGSGGGAGTNACTNASDLAAISATYGGSAGAGGAGQMYSDIVAACGLDCLGSEGQDDIAAVVACTQTCVSEQTNDAVSSTCTDCFTESALCAFNNCIGRCAADPASEGCLACRCNAPDSGNTGGVDCEARFAECSGVDRMNCQ